MSRKTPAFPVLDVEHWPRDPQQCQRCKQITSYTAPGTATMLWCVSARCDPHGLTWSALDGAYRRDAGKAPLQQPRPKERAENRARRRALKKHRSKS